MTGPRFSHAHGARRWGLIVCASAAMTSGLAHAQAASDEDALQLINKEAKDKDVFKFDFAVPASPALTLLGVDKDKVTQSNSLKPFVVSLPNVLSAKESGQSVALDVSPAWLLYPKSQRTYQNYKRGVRALLFRTRAAVAIYEGVDNADASKQKPSRASVGLSTSLLNSSDPLLAPLPGASRDAPSAWSTCLAAAAPAIRAALPPPKDTDAMLTLERKIESLDRDIQQIKQTLLLPGLSAETKQALEVDRARLAAEKGKLEGEWTTASNANIQQMQAAFAKTQAAAMIPGCMKVADLAARLGPDLDFGVGAVWDGKPGEASDFKDPSMVVWASYRHALGIKGPSVADWAGLKAWYDDFDAWYMIGFSARAGFDEAVSTGDKTTPKIRADTFAGWVGLERYSENTRFAVQVGRRKVSAINDLYKAFDGTRSAYLVSYDQKVADGIWVNLSHGEADGGGALKSDKTTRLAITFTSPEARKIFGGP